MKVNYFKYNNIVTARLLRRFASRKDSFEISNHKGLQLNSKTQTLHVITIELYSSPTSIPLSNFILLSSFKTERNVSKM